MLSFANRTTRKLLDPSAVPFLIGFGLATLLVLGGSTAPVLSAVGLIILGATLATIDRFSSSPALPAVLVLHSATYACVYGVFLGATLHKATSGAANGLTLVQTLDLIASALPVAVAAQRALAALRSQADLPR